MGDPLHTFSPSTYGRSFAAVYDDWYPADDTTDAAVKAILARSPEDGPILELGVGTGRLALPLVAAGRELVGMDASTEMLGALAVKSDMVLTALGDVGDPSDWPEGPFATVIAAFNLVCNLSDRSSQAAMFRAAHDALAPGGLLVVEAFVPAPVETRERRLEVRSVDATGVVLIATDNDPDTGVVVGQHIELTDGEPVRLRPWRIVPAPLVDLDRWADDAGFELVDRHGDWDGSPVDDTGAAHVSWYRRAPG